MNPILVLAIVGGLYLLLEKRNSQISSGIQVPTALAPSYQIAQGTDTGPGAGTQLAATEVSNALQAIPIVGGLASEAFNIFSGGAIAASKKRAAEATNENSAVAKAVPGWDATLAQAVNLYNNGQMTAQQFASVVMSPGSTPSGQGMMWQNYWREVGPQVQPGRNGCNTGTVQQNKSGPSFCQGAYGAGCCVAYDALDNGSIYVLQALAQAEANPGMPVTSKQIPLINASKYGGINRPAYTVTLRKPSSSAVSSLFGF